MLRNQLGSAFLKLLLAWTLLPAVAPSAQPIPSLRIATYNLENYLLDPNGTRPAKSPESRAQVCENIRLLNADVIALQEVGGHKALLELRQVLQSKGLHYPHWELVTGYDRYIQLAVLSRWPIVARRPHTNESFLLMGRRFKVSRGFLEVDIQTDSSYRFTLLNSHLKSKRPIGSADEAEMREQEAILLRNLVDARLQKDPQVNLVVLGDFNDTKNSRPLRTLLGRGRKSLLDTRPVESDEKQPTPNGPGKGSRSIAWTHYYATEDSYGRFDYILLSPGMTREWLQDQSFVQRVSNWGLASDHRAVLATFIPKDR